MYPAYVRQIRRRRRTSHGSQVRHRQMRGGEEPCTVEHHDTDNWQGIQMAGGRGCDRLWGGGRRAADIDDTSPATTSGGPGGGPLGDCVAGWVRGRAVLLLLLLDRLH